MKIHYLPSDTQIQMICWRTRHLSKYTVGWDRSTLMVKVNVRVATNSGPLAFSGKQEHAAA